MARTLAAQTSPTARAARSRISLVPKGETKHDKFVRLTNQRAKQAIKYIRLIGRLGSNQYERTSEEIEKISAALNSEVEKAVSNLRGSSFGDGIKDIL
jgi:uncharacterized protein YecE (DUF72 family)